MSREYLTVEQFSKKHNIPKSTVRKWIRDGKIVAFRAERPILIPEDQDIPVKDPDVHKWRYTWKSRLT